jgi:hypothetical protein
VTGFVISVALGIVFFSTSLWSGIWLAAGLNILDVSCDGRDEILPHTSTDVCLLESGGEVSLHDGIVFVSPAPLL